MCCKQSKLDCHQLAADWHALANVTSTPCQSENNPVTDMGTSLLLGPTEVSRRRTIQTIHFIFNKTPLKLQSFFPICQSSTNMPIIDQSANPMPIDLPNRSNPGLKAHRLKGTSAMTDLTEVSPCRTDEDNTSTRRAQPTKYISSHPQPIHCHLVNPVSIQCQSYTDRRTFA